MLRVLPEPADPSGGQGHPDGTPPPAAQAGMTLLSPAPSAPLWRPTSLPLSVTLTPAHLGLLNLLLPPSAPVSGCALTLSSVPSTSGPFVFPAPSTTLTGLNLRLLGLSLGGHLTLRGRTYAEEHFLRAYRERHLSLAADLHATLAKLPHWRDLYAALADAVRSLITEPETATADAVRIQLPDRPTLPRSDQRLLTEAHQLTPGPHVLVAHWVGAALTRHEVYTASGARVPLHAHHLTPSAVTPATVPDPGAPSTRLPFDLQRVHTDHMQHAMSLFLLRRRALLRGYELAVAPTLGAAPYTAVHFTVTA